MPSKRIAPASMTSTRSHRAETSSVWCVEISTVPARPERRPRRDARCSGSSPVVGSSRMSRSGRPIRACAMARRRRWPPDSFDDLHRTSVAEVDQVQHPAYLRGPGRGVLPLLQHRDVVQERRRGHATREDDLLGAVADPARASTRLACDAVTSSPATTTRPPLGGSEVESSRSSVVLPAPLGPRRPTTPGRRSTEVGTHRGGAAERLPDPVERRRRGHSRPPCSRRVEVRTSSRTPAEQGEPDAGELGRRRREDQGVPAGPEDDDQADPGARDDRAGRWRRQPGEQREHSGGQAHRRQQPDEGEVLHARARGGRWRASPGHGDGQRCAVARSSASRSLLYGVANADLAQRVEGVVGQRRRRAPAPAVASARNAASWSDRARVPRARPGRPTAREKPTAAAQGTSSELAAETTTRSWDGVPRRRSSLSGAGSTGSAIEVRTASQTAEVCAGVTDDLAASRHRAHPLTWVSTLASATRSSRPAAYASQVCSSRCQLMTIPPRRSAARAAVTLRCGRGS